MAVAVLLTTQEKEAIRNLACGHCGATVRSHTHRVIPGCEGGQYTAENTVPRCPKCHSITHDDGDGRGGSFLAQTVKQRRRNGKKGARALWDSMNAKERKAFIVRKGSGFEFRTQEELKEISRKGGLARAAKLTRAELLAIGKLAAASRTSEERRATMLKAQPWKHITFESRSLGGQRGTHMRWHVARNIKSQNCALCVGGE